MAQALPFHQDFLREHRGVLGVSLLIHVALVTLMAMNLDLMPRREPRPVQLAIQATVVDDRALRQRAREREQKAREALRAEAAQRAAETHRQTQEAEARRAEERRQLEERDRARAQQQAAREEQRKLAERRAAEAREAKTRADQQRKAEEARQRAAADAEKRSAAEAKRQAEAERRKAQTQADLARQLAEEEELLAAADSGLLDQYAEVIRQKVERNWIRPASARAGLNCVVLVKQIPGGDVVDVRVTECNGDAAVVRSIEAAVLRASPLPPPPDPKLFDRSLRFEFRPAE